MKYQNILDAIGNTPLIRLKNIETKFNLPFHLFAKLERSNPSGSVKDRAAYYIIKDGIEKGLIDEETTIIEATSGNMGISLAMVASALHLKCIIAMPSNASVERMQMMKAYGANLHLSEATLGMKGSVELANKLAKNIENHFLANQFANESNIKAHYETTSIEILKDLNDKLDVFIAGIGTGGTLIGNAKRFKEIDDKIEIIGVEPLNSPLLNQGKHGVHKIQGIGANFVPTILDLNLIDKVLDIKDEEAYEMSKILAKEEGILVGISSGAALAASLKLNEEKYKNKNVCIILPDNGERYLSVEGLYE